MYGKPKAYDCQITKRELIDAFGLLYPKAFFIVLIRGCQGLNVKCYSFE